MLVADSRGVSQLHRQESFLHFVELQVSFTKTPCFVAHVFIILALRSLKIVNRENTFSISYAGVMSDGLRG